MHRPGANPDAMSPGDFLCDFCARGWDGEGPVVEGHQGSLICGECLAAAYIALALDGAGEPSPLACTLCLEAGDRPRWVSPAQPDKNVCLRCVKQAATALAKSPDVEWSKPERA